MEAQYKAQSEEVKVIENETVQAKSNSGSEDQESHKESSQLQFKSADKSFIPQIEPHNPNQIAAEYKQHSCIEHSNYMERLSNETTSKQQVRQVKFQPTCIKPQFVTLENNRTAKTSIQTKAKHQKKESGLDQEKSQNLQEQQYVTVQNFKKWYGKMVQMSFSVLINKQRIKKSQFLQRFVKACLQQNTGNELQSQQKTKGLQRFSKIPTELQLKNLFKKRKKIEQ